MYFILETDSDAKMLSLASMLEKNNFSIWDQIFLNFKNPSLRFVREKNVFAQLYFNLACSFTPQRKQEGMKNKLY